jgi:hypothetical protein
MLINIHEQDFNAALEVHCYTSEYNEVIATDLILKDHSVETYGIFLYSFKVFPSIDFVIRAGIS